MLPALALSVAVIVFLITSVSNQLSRRVEARADSFSLQLTDEPDAFISFQRRIALKNVSDPDPWDWTSFLFGTHPTTVDRIGTGVAARERDDRGPLPAGRAVLGGRRVARLARSRRSTAGCSAGSSTARSRAWRAGGGGIGRRAPRRRTHVRAGDGTEERIDAAGGRALPERLFADDDGAAFGLADAPSAPSWSTRPGAGTGATCTPRPGARRGVLRRGVRLGDAEASGSLMARLPAYGDLLEERDPGIRQRHADYGAPGRDAC